MDTNIRGENQSQMETSAHTHDALESREEISRVYLRRSALICGLSFSSRSFAFVLFWGLVYERRP
jgi:hypothetical protein